MGLIDKINGEVAERIAEALALVEQHTAEVAAGLAQWQNGNRLTGARPLQVDGSPRLWGGSGRLVGWALTATGGPVNLLIRDSRVTGDGDVLAALALVEDQHANVWMGPGGVSFGEGLFLETTGVGALVGAVWLGAVD